MAILSLESLRMPTVTLPYKVYTNKKWTRKK
jgi:hypothetical protein